MIVYSFCKLYLVKLLITYISKVYIVFNIINNEYYANGNVIPYVKKYVYYQFIIDAL